jgi:DNA-binding beta-propeller fold protein YncE
VSIVDTVFDVTVGSVAALPTTEDVAGSPNGNRAYVGRQWCEGEGCIWSVTVVDVATRTPITVVPTSGVPRHIEVGPFGNRVFVVGSSSTANTLDVIDGATNAVLHSQEIDVPLPTLGFPQPPIFDARIDPTGTAIYLTNTGGVVVLDTTTYEVTPATARGGDHLSFDPLGTRAYVAGCSGPPESPCGIVVVDTGTRAVADVIPLDFRPIEAMLITPDGARGYVFGQFFENDAFISKVFSIDLQAAKASPTALRESDIWWLVLHPDTERFYSCESADGLTFVVKVLDVGNGGRAEDAEPRLLGRPPPGCAHGAGPDDEHQHHDVHVLVDVEQLYHDLEHAARSRHHHHHDFQTARAALDVHDVVIGAADGRSPAPPLDVQLPTAAHHLHHDRRLLGPGTRVRSRLCGRPKRHRDRALHVQASAVARGVRPRPTGGRCPRRLGPCGRRIRRRASDSRGPRTAALRVPSDPPRPPGRPSSPRVCACAPGKSRVLDRSAE